MSVPTVSDLPNSLGNLAQIDRDRWSAALRAARDGDGGGELRVPTVGGALAQMQVPSGGIQ